MNKCSVCHSKTSNKLITYTQWHQEKLIAVENVVAEVCDNCGEEYFSPDTVEKIQNVINNNKITRTMNVPVFQLA